MSQHFTGLLRSTPKEIDDFHKQIEKTCGGVYFNEVAPGLTESGKGKLITPYKSVQKFYPAAYGDEPQTTGDCTTKSLRDAIDLARACEIDVLGELEAWEARGASEYIYAARGHRGQGMNVARAAKLVNQYGILVRKNYPFVDLSKYDSRIGSSRTSVPQEWLEEMSKHPMQYITQPSKPEDVRDALANGLGVFRGAYNLSISNRRDDKGISHVNGSGWDHAQSVLAWDDTCDFYPEPLVGEGNQWGKWNSGGHPAWGPLPIGAYLMPLSEWVKRIYNQGDVWIVGDSKGFRAKDLPDYGASDWL